MKIAAQSVLWGSKIDDLSSALDLLAAYGCEGVEFCHRPEQLCDAETLNRMLAERNLVLVGLSGGTLVDRVDFCGDILRPKYLYIEDWDEVQCKAAIDSGFTLALHPHLFKPIHRLADAEILLEQHKELLFLPDVVHLTIAGDSPSSAILKWKDRLAAIHIKDWTPIYGRSSHRYDRGFVGLGEGSVKFDRLFETLRGIDYKGWLVLEQGKPNSSAEDVVRQATTWLSRRLPLARRMLPRKSIRESPIPAGTVTDRYHLKQIPYTPEEEKLFLDTVFHVATNEAANCYQQLSEAIGRLLKVKLVILCTCSPAANILGILGIYPITTQIKKNFVDYCKSLSSVALERQETTDFDLTSPQPAAKYNRPDARFGYPNLISRMALDKLVSVPVLNSHNPHQARFVLNIFPGSNPIPLDPEDLQRLGNLIAQAADSSLDERCAVAAAEASTRAGLCQQSDAFLTELRDLLLKALHCDALTIFLVDDTGQKLEEAKSTGLRWYGPASECYYTPKDNNDLVAKVWVNREAVLAVSLEGEGKYRKSDESRSSARPSCLCAPMLDVTGTVIGVVRCQNKKDGSEAGSAAMFSEDDIAIFDAVCQSAVPHLQVLLSKERRAKALRRLTHEINNPLVAMRGATDRMKRELIARFKTSEGFFREDYIGDMEGWVGLMCGLLDNADCFRLADRNLIIEQRRVHLYGDVFMPATNQITPLLADRQFERSKIVIPKFEEIPMLWIDKRLMIQVVFNLLSNAVKYSYEDPAKFRVMITGREEKAFYEVAISDYGPGIETEMAEAIFLEGVRSKHAERSNVSGDGLGLWIVRRAVEAHGGQIKVTSCINPTQFTIFLPRWLKDQKKPL